MNKGFGLFGAGSLGLSIVVALERTGIKFVGVNDTDADAARRASQLLRCPILPAFQLAKLAEVLLFAVPDNKIALLYKDLKPYIQAQTLVVHFSGAFSSEIFDLPLRLSAHPAQTFPHPRLEEDSFLGVFFALEGEEEALTIFRPILERIGAKTYLILKEAKPLYHAVCVMASNLVLALLHQTEALNEPLGLKEDAVRQVILHLANETITSAIKQDSITNALSGPVLRGDADTVAKNLEALKPFPEQYELYKLLSRELLGMAQERGLTPDKARRIEELLL